MRKNSFDLLRIVATFSVIQIHISQVWVDSLSNEMTFTDIDISRKYLFVIALLNTVCRFAVPCFIMLSGALNLSNSNNQNAFFFYKKNIEKIGIPTLIFSFLYVLYRLPFSFFGEKTGWEAIRELIIDVLVGKPMNHMWYLYMMFGIYFITPFIIKIIEGANERFIYIFVVIFFIMSVCSRWTTRNITLYWDVGQSFEYLSYYMVGYVIYKRNRRKVIRIPGGGYIRSWVFYRKYSSNFCF